MALPASTSTSSPHCGLRVTFVRQVAGTARRDHPTSACVGHRGQAALASYTPVHAAGQADIGGDHGAFTAAPGNMSMLHRQFRHPSHGEGLLQDCGESPHVGIILDDQRNMRFSLHRVTTAVLDLHLAQDRDERGRDRGIEHVPVGLGHRTGDHEGGNVRMGVVDVGQAYVAGCPD